MCFIEQGKAYFVEIDETFRMRRKLNSAATSEVFEETTTRRNLSPVIFGNWYKNIEKIIAQRFVTGPSKIC